MATGAWLGPGLNAAEPSDLDAFSRLYLGWAHPELVTHDRTLNLAAAEGSPTVAVVVPPGQDPVRTVYLLENREGAVAGGDADLPGRGLLVYRVDLTVMNPDSVFWQQDRVDAMLGTANGPMAPGISVVAANGSRALTESGGHDGSPGDPFPGRSHHEVETLPGGPGLGAVRLEVGAAGPVMRVRITFPGAGQGRRT